MNLSPLWVKTFTAEGWKARHWVDVGSPSAPDSEIVEWAVANGYIVFTHDLDFAAMLATQGLKSPSVIQLRTQEVLPDKIGTLVNNSIRRFESELDAGAVVSIDLLSVRARLLPLRG